MPNIWKEANVSPINKENNPSDVSNYRPISLSSTVKIVHKYLFNVFRDNNVITAFQSGFVPGDSTVKQLIFTIHFVKLLMRVRKFAPYFVT